MGKLSFVQRISHQNIYLHAYADNSGVGCNRHLRGVLIEELPVFYT